MSDDTARVRHRVARLDNLLPGEVTAVSVGDGGDVYVVLSDTNP